MPMPDLTAISAVATSLRATSDLAKAALGLRDAELVRLKIVELTGEIMTAQACALAAQAAQSALVDRVNKLEKQIVDFENWNLEKQRYRLTDLGLGTFAYTPKPGMEADEPPHKICAKCYQSGRKTILQRVDRDALFQTIHTLRCDTCATEIVERITRAETSSVVAPV